MVKISLIVISVLSLLVIGLIFAIRFQYKHFEKKIAEREAKIKEQYDNYNKEAEEVLNKNKEQKEKVHDKDDKKSFEQSLKILDELSKRGN